MRMVTVKQYAEKMASSESQIRQMCADGIIPSVKIGKGYKIDVERADLYFAMEIDKRLNEQRKKDDKKIIRANKKKSTSTFMTKIDALLKGVGKYGKDISDRGNDLVSVPPCELGEPSEV